MLTTHQIGEALGISYHAARRLLTRPFPLPFVLANAQRQGGGRERLYSIGVVLPRVKDAGFTDTPTIHALFKKGAYPWSPKT